MFILIVILAMFCLVFFLASISEDDRHSSHSSNENFSSTPSSLQIEEHFSNDKTSKKIIHLFIRIPKIILGFIHIK